MKSAYSSRKKVFLTQDESNFIERSTPDLINPSQELSSLKKKYDSVRQENIKKAQYLEWLDGKVLELKSTAASIQTDMQENKDRSEAMQVEIEKAASKLTQELELKRIYEHMLHRNKHEGTQLDIQVNKYNENVKSAKLRMDFEKEKARKSKDKKFSVQAMLKDLKSNLEEDTKKQESHIFVLENNIVQRKERLKRFEERTKRQAEIIELAARHDRESHEKPIRERIAINKLLFDLLIEKEAKYKKAGQEVEMAFQDIKTKTGYTDPRVILTKFTNREDIHNRLILSVERSETVLDQLRKEYHNVKIQLKELMLIAGSNVEESNEEGANQIAEAVKSLEKIQLQQRKVATVHKDVCKWAGKISERLGIKNNANLEVTVEKIAEKLNLMICNAQENKVEFMRNLKNYEKRKTTEIVKEIYKESHSPIKL